MRALKFFIGIFFILAFLSCGEHHENDLATRVKFTPPVIKPDEMVEEETSISANNSGLEKTAGNIDEKSKKIIKDGNISIKTRDLVIAKNTVDHQVKKYNAYYDNEEFQNDDEKLSYNLKIRIPSEKFEKFIEELEKGKNEIRSKSLNSRDITEEYIDIESRLKSKHDYLVRYKELLSKASTIKDIVAIEENIRKLQEEIESKEGRLKFLNDQISYSTLEVNLYQDIFKPRLEGPFFVRLKNAVYNGWLLLVNLILWIIQIWPLMIVVGILYILIKRFKLHKKVKH